jgi:dihydropteroate synthase
MAVLTQPGHCKEQVAGLHAARVMFDAGYVDFAVAFETCAGHPAHEIAELHAEGQHNRAVITDIGGHRFDWGSRTYVMGIINMTPDSFSGDGIGSDQQAAVAQGMRMVQEGADMLDVGGESTRPGHEPISVSEEIARTEVVVRQLARDSGVPVSIDTYKLEVAEAAVDAGATILNDIWGLVRSPALADLAARHASALVLMHNHDGTEYEGDLMTEIKLFLRESVRLAQGAGVPRERLLIDPGIGFGKTAEQNWVVMRRLQELQELELPVLIGTSRKSFIGKLLDLPVTDRLEGTAATVAASVLRGVDVVRVHDVQAMTRVVRVADHMR